MRLLLIRHAVAVEREDFAHTGKDDRLRPLTDLGRSKMKRVARGLTRVVPGIDLLAVSPLARAAQTGAILDDVYGGLDEVEIPELTPEARPDELLGWLSRQDADGTVALVGHEPALSHFLALLLTAGERPVHAFKKGGAALLDLPTPIAPGAALLLWALPPRLLARLGR